MANMVKLIFLPIMSMKDKLNHPIAILLMVVTFLTLTAIAAVEYSGDQAGSEKARQGALYRLGGACASAGEKFLGFLMVGSEKEVVDDSEANRASSGWRGKYVSLQQEGDDWQLVLKNSEGVIRSVSLKNIFKRSSSSE